MKMMEPLRTENKSYDTKPVSLWVLQRQLIPLLDLENLFLMECNHDKTIMYT